MPTHPEPVSFSSPLASEWLGKFFFQKKILIGISGSIAAIKSLDLIRQLKFWGADLQVVTTESALQFVTPLTLETLSGKKSLHSLWNSASTGNHHIDTARFAEWAIVCPASANTLAKLALGLASDLLSTELLAFQGSLFVVPAMNPAMYAHPATQSHIETLKKRGVHLLGPDSGVTSCGDVGEGRMLEIRDLLFELAATRRPRLQKKVLLTLGPTRSAIDPVRYLTNRSSGKMGAHLAWAAWSQGVEVVAVGLPEMEKLLPPHTRFHPVTDSTGMLQACQSEWQDTDLFLSTAAVLDWEVQNPSSQKIKKSDAIQSGLSISFQPSTDVLKTLSHSKGHRPTVFGFAAETHEGRTHALRKLQEKKLDYLFMNDVSQSGIGFESDLNAGILFSQSTERHFEPQKKSQLAAQLLQAALKSQSHSNPRSDF